MPLERGTSKKDCISKNISKEVNAGVPIKQAQAIAINHCGKIWGNSKNEIEQAKIDIMLETMEMEYYKSILEETKLDLVLEDSKNKKFIQKAIKKPGSFTEWCKKKGFDGTTNECIELALKSNNKKLQARAKLARALRNIAKKK